MGRVVTLFGTRPEAIKLAPVIRALEGLDRPAAALDVVNVSSGQHTDLVRPFTDAFGVEVHRDLAVGKANQSATDVCAGVLARFDELLSELEPDIVLVQGDTTTAMAGALAAFQRKIRVGHVEAGLRSGDRLSPFPEEMNRRLITRLASIHFAATRRNVDTLEAEGVEPATIALSGNPIVDAVRWALDKTEPSARMAELQRSVGARRLIVVTTHRRESFGEVMISRLRVLSRFAAEHDDVAIVFPVHPNPHVRRAVEDAMPATDRVHLVQPLGYFDFIHLLAQAWLIVSDSGGIQEEAPTLGTPVLVIRENTERPEAIEAGVAKLVGAEAATLEAMLEECYMDAGWAEQVSAVDNPFGAPGSGDRIARATAALIER